MFTQLKREGLIESLPDSMIGLQDLKRPKEIADGTYLE